MILQLRCCVALAASLLCACTGDTVALGDLPWNTGGGPQGPGADGSAFEAAVDGSLCGQNVYPQGPYGIAVGDVLDPSLPWQVPSGVNPAEMSISTYYEPKACLNVRALVLLEVGWDSASDTAHQACVAAVTTTWAAFGVRVVELVSAASGGAPATADDAAAWKAARSSPLPVGADPTRSLFVEPAEQPPLAVVVDPCTMRITGRYAGCPVGEVKALASQPGCTP